MEGSGVELRPLGSTALRISVLGLGTVKLGRAQGVKYPRPVTIPTDDEAEALLAAAAERGINFIDTAPAYGNAEERLGSLLGGQRDRWVIATKAGEEFENGQSRFDFSPRAIRASVERSLVRLRTDRLDLVLIHSDGEAEKRLDELGVFEELAALRSAGKILAFGVSVKSLEGATLAIARCDAVMVALNPGETTFLPAVAAARERRVGVLIKKALGSGHLVKTTSDLEQCLGLSVRTPGVSSVIIGTANRQHLEQACDAAGRITGR
ncbi:MAG: aldo/keto reductase [Planctomycetes bacterium]|nr:aldo/keto reductase [Planctomycetota bacterium]